MNKTNLWFVEEEDLTTTPSALYHENSKLGKFRTLFGEPDPKKSKSMLELIKKVAGKEKSYEYFPQYSLHSDDWDSLNRPLGEALKKRRTLREFAKGELKLKDLSTLLVRGAGINGELHYPDGHVLPVRTYPSGGGLYPLEIYVALFDTIEIPPGIYHFNVSSSSLSLLAQGNYRNDIYKAFIDDPKIEKAVAVIIVTAVFPRSRFKYGERSYRFIMLEAGHLSQNLILVGQSLGLSVVPMGGYLDREMENLLEIDGVEECIIYPQIIGIPIHE